MKTFLVAAVLTVGLFTELHAQQTIIVDFVNTPGTLVTDCETGQPVGSGYVAAIYWGSGTDRRNYVQVGGTMQVINGRIFSSGSRTITTPGSTTTLNLYGAAWQSAAGPTYDMAAQVPGAKVGQSAIFTVTPLSPPTPTPVRIPDFQVCPVPEPSAVVLFAVGLGSLGLIRFRAQRRN